MVTGKDLAVNMKKFRDLKIFIVGCGSIGKRHTEVLRLLGVKEIVIYDYDLKKAEALLPEFPDLKTVKSFEDGLKMGPDAVFILTPTKLHPEMIKQSIENGCNVFCEKPLSDSMDGIDDLIKIQKNTKLKVMVGHCFRYHEGLLKAKEILLSGKIGRLILARSLMGEHLPAIRPDYKSLYLAQYSGVFELMHDIDLVLWYAGRAAGSVKAFYGNYSDIGITAPDTAEIIIDFEKQCLASVHLDFFQIPRRRYIELIGTDGVIIVEFGSWDKYNISIFEKGKNCWQSSEYVSSRNDMFIAEDSEFLNAIIEDTPVSIDLEEASKVIKVLDLIKNNN
jgi:predicted dehydrogenase